MPSSSSYLSPPPILASHHAATRQTWIQAAWFKMQYNLPTDDERIELDRATILLAKSMISKAGIEVAKSFITRFQDEENTRRGEADNCRHCALFTLYMTVFFTEGILIDNSGLSNALKVILSIGIAIVWLGVVFAIGWNLPPAYVMREPDASMTQRLEAAKREYDQALASNLAKLRDENEELVALGVNSVSSIVPVAASIPVGMVVAHAVAAVSVSAQEDELSNV